ncbi:MAG: alpha-2-macroglobulin family protein, partial [Verrucomicrobiia bacterium]
LPAVRQKLREFTLNARDPATGQTLPDPRGRGEKAKETTPLIPFFNLKVLGTGTFDASPENDEIQRQLIWRPTGDLPPLNGPCLLEITAPGPDGALYGNRSIVWFTEVAATQKRSPTTLTIRVADFEKGEPLPNVKVIAASADNISIESSTTDADGMVSLPIDRVFPTKTGAVKTDHFLIIDGQKTYWLPASPERFSSGWSYSGANIQGLRGAILTDRPLYRPGEELRIKGMIREYREGVPRLPARNPVAIQISGGPSGAPVASLSSELSPVGGWDVAWTVPADLPLGHYYISASLGDSPVEANGWFQVEEFRKPLFSIQVEKKEDAPPQTDVIEVSSTYFHGSPNVGATVRWRSTWYSSDDWDDDIRYIDRHSENPPNQTYMAEAEGEAFLDREGRVRIELRSPFQDGAKRARCWVTWSVDVLSPEGQTLSAGTSHLRQLIPAAVGIATKEVIEPVRGLEIKTVAVNEANEPAEGLPVEVVVYHVETKTIREQLAPQVVRFNNRSIFSEVDRRRLSSGETFVFPTDQTGPFVATARLIEDANAPMVSDRSFLTGKAYASFPWEDSHSLKLELEKSSFVPGDRAIVKLASPESGMAWVTIESKEILDSMLIPVESNTARIEVPVKKAYAPSATVAVYLLTPGGSDRLPKERFGYVHMAVERPDLTLKIEPKVVSEKFEPRAKVRGQVLVTSEGAPIPGAEVAIWVVDEAILQLGSWSLPNLLPLFLPGQPYSVTTFSALGSLVSGVHPRSLFHKGFVIGDGGEGDKGNLLLVRENFQPLAFFRGAIDTDDAGVATFEFEAPDTLTTWRVVAVGHTPKHQFGAGSSTFEVSKNLMIEPALPRFVRTGDQFELRAVVRQRLADAARIRVTAEASGGITLLGESSVSVEAGRDAPAVVRLPAQVDGAPGEARIFFRAEGPGASDAFDVPLPIASPDTTIVERIAGVLKQDTKLEFKKLIPAEWRGREGTFHAAVSSSPYFTKMEGLP